MARHKARNTANTTSALATGINPSALHSAELVTLLRGGEHAPVLAAYFGEALYRELRPLALHSATPAPGERPRVYVLPGLMGSKLGVHTRQGVRNHWLNPQLLESGELMGLALPARRRLQAWDAMPPTYLKLQLLLQAAGFDVRLYAYDWRRSIAKLGKALAAELKADPAQHIMLVAHSMGGLVARAALRCAGGEKIARLVQLGTPNQGSFALVQALRGIYPTIHKLAALDARHDVDALVGRVFRTLPGLYEMLPQPAAGDGLDLFDANNWPQDALRPDAALLKKARALHARLGAADARCHVIAGVDQRTLVGVERARGGFRYRFSNEGDGTVPLSLCHWPGATSWYAPLGHGELPKDTTLCKAVIDLLQTGATQRLAKHWHAAHAHHETRSEAELRPQLRCKLRWIDLPLEERRSLLEPVISPAFQALCDRAPS